MKVAHKEPIQSLNAFGRHINGGSNAALPLFLIKPLVHLVAVITCLSISTTSAQPKDTNKLPSDEKQIDLLFDRIMKTLPDAERSKVDSAATVQTHRSTTSQGVIPPAVRERETSPKTTAQRVEDLPPELRAQVERTINSMESRREERKAQFRETAREQRR
jgi:hypothetical protein